MTIELGPQKALKAKAIKPSKILNLDLGLQSVMSAAAERNRVNGNDLTNLELSSSRATIGSDSMAATRTRPAISVKMLNRFFSKSSL